MPASSYVKLARGAPCVLRWKSSVDIRQPARTLGVVAERTGLGASRSSHWLCFTVGKLGERMAHGTGAWAWRIHFPPRVRGPRGRRPLAHSGVATPPQGQGVRFRRALSNRVVSGSAEYHRRAATLPAGPSSAEAFGRWPEDLCRALFDPQASTSEVGDTTGARAGAAEAAALEAHARLRRCVNNLAHGLILHTDYSGCARPRVGTTHVRQRLEFMFGAPRPRIRGRFGFAAV